MAQAQTDNKPAGPGKAFFERAEQVAETGNWDFAIEMYLQGIAREPENIERGHEPLKQVALKRKMSGGKASGMFDKNKPKGGKAPVDALVKAEYVWAKEPGSVANMVAVMTAAQKMELKEVVHWMANNVFDAEKLTQRAGKKPNLKILRLLTQTYHDLEDFQQGVQTCQLALDQAPDDGELRDALKELMAKYTLQKGKYGQEGDFLKGVKDVEKQKELLKQDAMVKDDEFLEQQVTKAMADYETEPNVPGKVNAVVDALLKFEDEPHENQAIEILKKAHRDLGAYSFKMRVGDVTIRQMRRKYQELLAAKDKARAAEAAKELLAFELDEYTERAANYPTDLNVRYELGRRYYASGRTDDAIAAFQQSSRDPRRHISALNYLAQCFAQKQWYREAAETFARLLQADMSEDRAKEIRYNYGDVLDKMDELAKAREQFSMVAQSDFNFKDVRQRIEDIETRLKQQGQ